MKILKPSSISGEIFDLIDSARKKVIIVSPYHEITGWEKLINKIKKAQSKKIEIVWYSRKNAKQKNPDELSTLFNIKPILIDDLHAKIYLNEKNAVITSLNLCKASDEKSTDIGHITETVAEYNEIYDFISTYIKTSENVEYSSPSTNAKQKNKEDSKLNINDIDKKISESRAANGIHDHFIKKYKTTTFSINKEHLYYNNLPKGGYKIEFEFYEKAIKILLTIPQNENYKFENGDKIRDFINKHTLSSELDFWDSRSCIKYFYKSNFIIKDWEKRQLDFFLTELDLIIELALTK